MLSTPSSSITEYQNNLLGAIWNHKSHQARRVFSTSAFLVCVPVFFEAPLVRLMPLVSVLLTIVLVLVSFYLLKRTKTQIWGDLLLGFSYSWLAGAIYWGWFRSEPLLHLPVEGLCLPFVLYALSKGKHQIGGLFYLGSLVGTIITDIYFFLTGLIPYWRQIMSVEQNLASPILHQALIQVQNPWGISWAIVLVNLLLALGLWSIKQEKLYWWGFAGAVLSTILVDSLFLVAAYLV